MEKFTEGLLPNCSDGSSWSTCLVQTGASRLPLQSTYNRPPQQQTEPFLLLKLGVCLLCISSKAQTCSKRTLCKVQPTSLGQA